MVANGAGTAISIWLSYQASYVKTKTWCAEESQPEHSIMQADLDGTNNVHG